MNVVGSIPCSGCGVNVVRGIVYKIGENSFICDDCHDSKDEMYVIVDETKNQYEEIDD